MKYDPGLPPRSLARLLGLGGAGRSHLARLANTALDLAGKAASVEQGALLLEMGADFLLAAWEADPLDGRLASMLLALAHKLPILPGPVLEALRAVAGNWREMENTAYLDRLEQDGDAARLLRYLEGQARRAPLNLAWVQRLARLGLESGDLPLVQAALAPLAAPGLRAATLPLLADAALAAGVAQAAPGLAAEAAAGLPLPGAQSRLARALLLAGQRNEAAEALNRSLAARPWRTEDRLLRHDIESGADQALAPLPGRLRVLLAGAEAPALDAALAALVPGLPADATISALALGSDDAAALLGSWADRLGADRMATEQIPLDPGRPATRNWLLARPGAAEADWLLFADPGAIPAGDWAGRLGAALAAHPRAAAAGCRILDAANPRRVLAAAGGLLFGLEGELGEHPAPGGGQVRFAPGDLHADLPDLGRFTFLRPCLFVSGSFFLVRSAVLREERFDLRFSPRGFDTADLLLRLALKGERTVCQGHLAVAAPDPSLAGVEEANLYKLQKKHQEPGVQALAQAQESLTADALRP